MNFGKHIEVMWKLMNFQQIVLPFWTEHHLLKSEGEIGFAVFPLFFLSMIYCKKNKFSLKQNGRGYCGYLFSHREENKKKIKLEKMLSSISVVLFFKICYLQIYNLPTVSISENQCKCMLLKWSNKVPAPNHQTVS